MWLAYIDESKDQNNFFAYSALIVDSDNWNTAFENIKLFRRWLKQEYGVYVNKELHAWKFCAGKGAVSSRVLTKEKRAEIFFHVLRFVAQANCFKVISAVNTREFYCFDRFINRLNRTAQAHKTNVILICDEGQEAEFTKRIRKMRVLNFIPSNRGVWQETGTTSKNIPVERVIEDPVFKDSRTSYFIQIVDFIAYALLRYERPIPSRTIYGYHQAYPLLYGALERAVNPRDPKRMGIIR